MSHSSKEEIARRTEAAVRDRSMLRLMVLGVLVFSLVITLFARLFYLQVVESAKYESASANNSVREIVRPAVRGLILDQAGRPIVSNRTTQLRPPGGAENAQQKPARSARTSRPGGKSYHKIKIINSILQRMEARH